MKQKHSELLKNEFLFFNDQQKLTNQIRKDIEARKKQTESYNHFPFTSGEQVELHKKELGKLLGEDLRNFMQMKQTRSPFLSDTSSVLNSRAKKTSMTPGRLKPLFDSSYVPPFRNPAVIQEHDPVKRMTLQFALRRH